jgi:hypothetical protein
MGHWPLDAGCNMDENYAPSLLEEFKSNKTKCLELSEIVGHVVEFRYLLNKKILCSFIVIIFFYIIQ